MEISSVRPPATFAVARRCIQDRIAHIGVVGLGPAGLGLSRLFSESGFVVEGFELSSPHFESAYPRPTFQNSMITDQISKERGRGRFQTTSDLSKLADTEVIIISLPPPFDEDHNLDFRFLRETIFSIASTLHPGHLVIMESVCYPGATEELVVPILESANGAHLKVSRDSAEPNDIFVGVAPERLDLGGFIDQQDVPKLVSGVDRFACELTADLYGKVFKRILRLSSPTSAEAARLLESAYQSVNIALAHEFKQVCFSLNIDPWEIIAAANTRPDDFHASFPGPGVGGRHIPFDCFSLSWKAKACGVRTKLTELATEINEDMPNFILRSIGEAFNRRGQSIKGSNILVLGITYQKDNDDLYESPSLTIIELLLRAGARVDYNDPFVPYLSWGERDNINMTSTPLDDLSCYDAVVIVTNHSGYNLPRIVSQAKLVIDTRNATRGMEADNIFRC